MFILDTNVVSQTRRPERADKRVLDWLRSQRSDDLYISVVTLLEVRKGALLMARRDPAQGKAMMQWLSGRVMPAFADRTLAIDAAVALQCAELHVPNPRSERDALIGATALVHGMTVVTRNATDFDYAGIALINP